MFRAIQIVLSESQKTFCIKSLQVEHSLMLFEQFHFFSREKHPVTVYQEL